MWNFWKRYSTKAKAQGEAKKLRKMGKRAKVVPLGGKTEKHNFDVYVGL